MTRTFIAIELGDAARAYLGRQIARLRAVAPAARWVAPQSVHLTLAFLGELDDASLARATEAAAVTAPREPPFTLRISGLGSFGSPRAPTVIWAGVGGETAALTRVQAALGEALRACGFQTDPRPFSPHLTLARVRDRLPPAELERLTPLLSARLHPSADAAITARDLSVMKSELAREGAKYTQLRAFPLGSQETPAAAPAQG